MNNLPSCSIILTNFNGLENLKKCLPGIIKSAKPPLCKEIIIVDDGSEDKSCEFIKNEYPNIKLIKLGKNTGFGIAANRGIRESSEPIVVLLSNDTVPKENFLEPLLEHFGRDMDIFAVGSKKLKPDGSLDDGRKIAKFLLGRVKFDKIFSKEPSSPDLIRNYLFSTFYVGGFGAFDREKFLELGGFYSLYLPFYWEDTDLCYRAAKRGWKIVYEPLSEIYHYNDEMGTIKNNFSKDYTKVIKLRNELFFIWSNFDYGFLIRHFFWLLFRLAFSWMILDLPFYKALLLGIKDIKKVLEKRRNCNTINDEKDHLMFQRAQVVLKR